MQYNIILRGVGARQCRAPTGVPHGNENRYMSYRFFDWLTYNRDVFAAYKASLGYIWA
ncbi:hypothetical protein [Nostoc sp. 'Lobaria pulmonaria (5183) cyanobiont']|uniref:hypothetical protein n=1 Tax=Nostoc sp. 'Lobaria pulmonaria (5183) cyanobiont' TaxID=1618022 RepID=UPI001319CEE7|nr:hypothetical protein [Nostoc sp. 'Lobaria pulmonaria (5183) cyanobiont']